MFDRIRADAGLMTSIERAVTAIPGVERVLSTRPCSRNDRPIPIVRAAALTNFEGRSGDLIIVARPNWPLGGRAAAEAGSHGAPRDYDQQVPVILFGAGVKAGRYDRAGARRRTSRPRWRASPASRCRKPTAACSPRACGNS